MTYYTRPRSSHGGPAYGLEYLGSIRRYPFSYYPTYSARPRYARHGHLGRLGGPPLFTNAQLFELRPRQYYYERPVRVGVLRGRYYHDYGGDGEGSDSSDDDGYRPRGRGHGHRGGHGHPHYHHHHHHGHGGRRADEWLEDPRDDYGANILGRRPRG